MKSKFMIAGMTAAAGAGFLAAKKRYDNKHSYHKILSRLEDYISDMR
ncbi:MAG TPA: hypothetical protein VFJ84_03175 [Candidatus Saccharimonadales bacterium]|nr:hypothetical protein [Candidatus Saccharimonadales bacterium]